jgi:hypothetical protein
MVSSRDILTGAIMPTPLDHCCEISHRPLDQRQTALFHRPDRFLPWLAVSAVESARRLRILLSRLAEMLQYALSIIRHGSLYATYAISGASRC